MIGDIAFIRGTSFMSRMIRLFDKGEFSHVVMFVEDGRVIEAEYSTKVRIRDFDYQDYEIIRMNLDGKQRDKVQYLAHTYEGASYDFKQIAFLWLRLVLGIDYFKRFNDPKQVVCSELVGSILMDVGINNEDLVNMAPNELYGYLKGSGY